MLLTPEGAARQLHTLRDWLRYTVSRFEAADLCYGHGTQNSYDEAAWLVLATLSLPHDTLENFFDAVLTEPERLLLAQRIERRVTERIPTAYLVREAWLGGLKFYVDERVIVPRSFIAELLGRQLLPWVAKPEEVVRVADICTGSGCLAILAAHAFPNADVDAVDISAAALAVAERNIADYGLGQQVRAIQSNMLDALADHTYDIILSNPPYVDAYSMAALPPEYRHEPAVALAGGQDGLRHIHCLLREAGCHLNPGGLLVAEIGHNRNALEAAYPKLPFIWADVSAGNDYVFLLHREDLV